MLDLRRLASLGEALSDATIAFKSNVALIEANRGRESARYTYLEMRRAAERFGAHLQKLGLAPGDRCAILMSNQSKWVISGMGALWAGAVLVPLDYKLSAPEQAALLAHAKPTVLVTEHAIWRDLAPQPRAGWERAKVLVSELPDAEPLHGASRWEQTEAESAQLCPVTRHRDDLACIVYSSGTGGTPKGCMLTHDSYLEQAQVLGSLYPMNEDDRYFSILPTNHAIDFMCGMIVPFLFGASVVHQRTLRPEFLMRTMQQYGITHMALVPRILQTLRERILERIEALPDWQRLALDALIGINDMATARAPRPALSSRLLKPLHEPFGGRLRLIFCGGAFVDKELAQFFYTLGLPVVIGYGLSEACTVITLNDLKPFRGDTVGRPVPGTRVELRHCGEDGVGEVYVQSRTVMRGYLDAPELTEETLIDGWLRTGDLGVFDAAGHLKLVGRAKNLIVTEGGKNVYPEDVEAAFANMAGCEEHCVFAANYVWPARGMTGEQLMIVLRPREGAELGALLQELRERNRRLPDFKRVSGYVRWSDELPRTVSMKIKRHQLAERLREAGPRETLLQPLEGEPSNVS